MGSDLAAQKTVFVFADLGVSARYLLRTDVLEILKRAGVRIVAVVPNPDEPYMQEELGGPNVVFERHLVGLHDSAGSGLWSLATHLREFTLGSGASAATLQARYTHFRTQLSANRRVTARLIGVALQLLWRSRLLRRLLSWVETRLLMPSPHRELFERYQPDLVVAASLGFYLPDSVVLNEARRHGVPSVGVVMAWDNPTSKGYRGADPDRAVAWSETMVEQLWRYQDYPRERTFVGGVPRFDIYVREGELIERERLFEALGLDPDRKLIFLAARSATSYPYNLVVARTLADAIERDELGAPAQLVVRPHPASFHPGREVPVGGYEELAAEHPHVHVDMPQVRSVQLARDVPVEDDVRLGSLLRHCDVLVNMFSTTTLEAFLLDRPVVNVSSEAHLGAPGAEQMDHDGVVEPRPFERDTHLESMARHGAARVARSMDELVELTRTYIEHPELDREARLAVAREECGPTDGHAGERVGRYLLEMLGVEPDGEPLGELDPVERATA